MGRAGLAAVHHPFDLLGKLTGLVVHAGRLKVLDGNPQVVDATLHFLAVWTVGTGRLGLTAESGHQLAARTLKLLGLLVTAKFAQTVDLTLQLLQMPRDLFSLTRRRTFRPWLVPLSQFVHLTLDLLGRLVDFSHLGFEHLGAVGRAVGQLFHLTTDGLRPLFQLMSLHLQRPHVAFRFTACMLFPLTRRGFPLRATEMGTNRLHPLLRRSYLPRDLLTRVRTILRRLAESRHEVGSMDLQLL